MAQRITIFGFGVTGRLIAGLLVARGDHVRVATRHQPMDLPAEVEHLECDVLNPGDLRRALTGVSQAVLAVGFPYDSRLWRTAWPRTMTNLIEACVEAPARLVFIDGFYQLGPQAGPQTETMS